MTGIYVGLLLGSTYRTSSHDPMKQQQWWGGQRQRTTLEHQASFSSDETTTANTDRRFPDSIRSFAVGMAVVDRNSLATTLDMGVPLDPSMRYNNQVLILYQSDDALPDGNMIGNEKYQAIVSANASSILLSVPTIGAVDDALMNCHAVHVLLTQPSNRHQCLAIMHQYESFHLQKFMRLPETSGPVNAQLPLRLVNRGAQANGRKSTKPPSLSDTTAYWAVLNTYLANFESNLAVVGALARSVAIQNTVIVLVCNEGQSDLLVNFICANRYRGLSTSHILVFATDEETRDKMQQLDIAVVYDSTQQLPKQAAGRYADATFAKMMLAKVWCVQQIVWLGYNVLFQDVDVIWFKDPLPYFLDAAAAGQKVYDMYFQDDGNHAEYYAPYSANTGFYFVRANDKTRHFFNSLLLSGDLIASTKSHQIPLCALLAEHASMYGLTVHIWNRDTNEFPGGHAYHRRTDFMRQLISGKLSSNHDSPYILHMSWTNNKNNKIKFFQQMEEWYVGGDCVACCAAKPIFQCHYRDKPSKRSCADSPPIDKGARSFW